MSCISNKNFQNDLHTRIEDFLKKNGMTKKKFADLVGVSPSYVSLLTNPKGKNVRWGKAKDRVEAVLDGKASESLVTPIQINVETDILPLIKKLADSALKKLTFGQFQALCLASQACSDAGLVLPDLIISSAEKNQRG